VLRGKRIILGISGSIAAYKSVLLVRELVKLGAEVQVICTKAALDFVTPITLATLSNRPVFSEFVKSHNSGEWTNHVELGKWADLLIVAPMSANTLSKLVSGNCDNLLIATYLSADCPIYVAPAMDLDMYKHWTTTKNLDLLREQSVNVIDSDIGALASGLVGKGRMAEPETLLSVIKSHFEIDSNIQGKRLIITAGPTYEKIDPVRFIGNYSSGKMGFAIAEEAHNQGAIVTLITGPTSLDLSSESIKRIDIESAQEMFEAVKNEYEKADAVIMSAAVADYRPKVSYESKLKKADSAIDSIELEDTTDILKWLGTHKDQQRLIGFALETDNELLNAQKKLENKNLDMLVMNSLNDEGAGFGTDTNKVTFIFPESVVSHELKSKKEVAKDIIDALETII
jgi:phosphopantothenoylcysteine decarboxylase / phosphopantothenate---cysteine ligase